jgi:hypothetical protein
LLTNKIVIIKLNTKERIHDKELQILMIIAKHKMKAFPVLLDEGKIAAS